jgi:hypothetical protein
MQYNANHPDGTLKENLSIKLNWTLLSMDKTSEEDLISSLLKSLKFTEQFQCQGLTRVVPRQELLVLASSLLDHQSKLNGVLLTQM